MDSYRLRFTPDDIHLAGHDPSIQLKLQMSGPSNNQTGYGVHFIELVRALMRCGHDITVWPTYAEPPIPEDFLTTFTKPWDPRADIGIVMADPYRLERIAKHTIGMTTWETTKLPANEVRRSLSAADELIVPCKDNIALFEELCPDKPIHVVPEGVDTTFFTPVERNWSEKPLRIGIFGATSYRKGIDLAMQAFLNLYADNPDVELHIASSQIRGMPALPSIDSNTPNIFFHRFGNQSRRAVHQFYCSMHALLAPSRGEGWYLPGPEFMATGGILIAPDKLGFAEYVQKDTCVVIENEWGPVDHWGFEGMPITHEKFGNWITYPDGAVEHALQIFVEMPVNRKIAYSLEAVASVHFHCPWDLAADKVTKIYVDRLRQMERTGALVH